MHPQDRRWIVGVLLRLAFSALIAWGTRSLFGFEVAVLVMLTLIFGDLSGVPEAIKREVRSVKE